MSSKLLSLILLVCILPACFFVSMNIVANTSFPSSSSTHKSFLSANTLNHTLNTILSQLSFTTTTAPWVDQGPHPVYDVGVNTIAFSGRVTAIAVNGSNPSNIYIGGAQGGVWKSLDAGSTWTPISDSQLSLAIGSLVFSPDNKTLYVGTGEANQGYDSYPGSGLLKTTDGGTTWTTLGANSFNKSAISSIVINKTNPNILVVGTTWTLSQMGGIFLENPSGLGAFYSSNGGVTWIKTNLTAGVRGGVAGLVADPYNNNFVYAGDFNGNIWQSNDAGLHWHIVVSHLQQSDQGRVSLALTPANPNYLYAAFVNSSDQLFAITEYDTSSWTPTSLALPNNNVNTCGSQCGYDSVLAVDPQNTNTLYWGGISLYKSINGGSTWVDQYANLYAHTDQHALVFNPGVAGDLYVGNDGGIWGLSSTSSWTDLNTGELGITQFASIAVSPFANGLFLGGTQDNGCIGTNSTFSWNILNFGDGAWAGFDPTYSNIEYCDLGGIGFSKSIDGGQTFYANISGLNTADPTNFFVPIAQDNLHSGTLYFPTNRVYKTTDYGSSWTALTGIITDTFLTSIAISPINSSILYVGDYSGHVRTSINGGTTWTNVSLGPHGLVPSIAPDPKNASRAYAVIDDVDNKYNVIPQIFRTQDYGKSWQNISLSGLPAAAINVIKINPNNTGLYIGTDRGVYYSTDDGASWTQYGSNLPNSAVVDLAFTSTQNIVAATHGRGVWENAITPFYSLSSPLNNTVLKSGIAINLVAQDTTYANQFLYHWDANVNNTVSGSFNSTLPSGDGQHSLYLYIHSTNGIWSIQKYFFITDDTPPTITLISPVNTSIVHIGDSINASASDTNGIQVLLYNWDGTMNTTITTISNVLVPNTVGNHTLNLFAEDVAGNWAHAAYTFTITPVPTSSSPSTSTSSKSSPSTSTSSKLPGTDFILATICLTLFSLLVLFRRRKLNF